MPGGLSRPLLPVPHIHVFLFSLPHIHLLLLITFPREQFRFLHIRRMFLLGE